MSDGINGERYRRQHKQYSRERRRFGKCCGRATRAKCGLTALSAKSRRNVSGLTALQQNDNNEKQANHYMDGSDQDDHEIEKP